MSALFWVVSEDKNIQKNPLFGKMLQLGTRAKKMTDPINMAFYYTPYTSYNTSYKGPSGSLTFDKKNTNELKYGQLQKYSREVNAQNFW